MNGERHIANMSDPQIPAALAPAIVGIVSLHDFKPRAQHEMRRSAANYTFSSAAPPMQWYLRTSRRSTT